MNDMARFNENQWKLNVELSLVSATIYDTTEINNFCTIKHGANNKEKREKKDWHAHQAMPIDGYARD